MNDETPAPNEATPRQEAPSTPSAPDAEPAPSTPTASKQTTTPGTPTAPPTPTAPNHTNASEQPARYLGALEAALADAPARARREILADVRAHIDDALEQGRSIDDVLAALGPMRETVAQYRRELGLPETAPPDTGRGSALLHGAAVAVAVLTGCFVAFVIPSFTGMFEHSAQPENGTPATLASGYGLGVALLAFVPALLAVLPLVLPSAARTPVAVANAAVVAILAAITFERTGMFYVPLAVLMWAAVVVPWRVANGLDLARSPLWRIFGGLLLALPGLLLIGGMIAGPVILTVSSLLLALALIAVAVLFAFGVRASYYLIAAVGFAVMVFAILDLGLLTIAIWWTGGAWLAIGLSAVATLRPRSERKAVA